MVSPLLQVLLGDMAVQTGTFPSQLPSHSTLTRPSPIRPGDLDLAVRLPFLASAALPTR
jgi:hypothetical protein